MKILSITAQKPSSTGSGVYLTEVMNSLDSLGFEQAIVFGKMPDDPDTKYRQYPVNFMSDALPFPIAGMSDVMPYEATRYCDFTEKMTHQFIAEYTRVISEAILDFDPDAIICHHLYLVTAIASHLNKNAKIVGLSHGTDIRQMKKHDLCASYIKEGICKLDKIYVLHAEQRDEIAKIYGADPQKIAVLGTGYNSKVFYNKGEFVPRTVVYVGKISNAKGVPQLIEACNKINCKKLTLVGGHSNEEEYAKIQKIAKGVNYELEFTGVIPREEVVARYNASQVFCIPSFFEGLPLVTLEAVACGCSAVMTDLPGIKDFYEQYVPDAPIQWVTPPRMQDVDVPLQDDLPEFVDNLANALEKAFDCEPNPKSVAVLSWDNLAKRLIGKAEAL